jgi:hypothetical protein
MNEGTGAWALLFAKFMREKEIDLSSFLWAYTNGMWEWSLVLAWQ